MKRIVMIVASILLIGVGVFAADGDLIVNGKVGIGSTSPAAKLDVQELTTLGTTTGNYQLLSRLSGLTGNRFMENTWLYRDSAGSSWLTARIHNGISVDSSYLVPNVDDRVWWERDPYNNIQSWGDQANTYLTINNGNVGIGTTSPGEKLHVEKTIGSVGLKMRAPGDGTGAAQITMYDSTDDKYWLIQRRDNAYASQANNLIFAFWDGTSWNQGMNLQPNKNVIFNGNVGIGTTNPQHGMVSIHSANTPLVMSETDQTGAVGYWRVVTDNGGLRIDQNKSADRSLNSYRTPFSIDISGNLRLGGYAGVAGENETMLISANSGSVGIGTTPWSKTSVYGGGTVGDVSSARQLAVGLGSTHDISMGYFQIGTNQSFAGVIQARDFSVGTFLSLNPAGGNVGIGTTTPTTTLQVKGSVSLGNAVAPQANRLLCWTSTGTIGYCQSVITTGVSCTCTAIN